MIFEFVKSLFLNRIRISDQRNRFAQDTAQIRTEKRIAATRELLRMSIFHLNSYREVIDSKIAEFASYKGYKTVLSQVMQIQGSHLSQVLSGKVNLTPDQGARLCDHWFLNELEAEYFINLIHYERATTESLKEKIEKQLDKTRLSFTQVSNIVDKKENNHSDKSELFYSSWLYPAVHATLQILGSSNEKMIADRLGISRKATRSVLEDLKEMKLAANHESDWSHIGGNFSILKRNLCNLFHSELRSKAHEIYSSGDTEIIRYTGLSIMPTEFFVELRRRIETFISEYHKEVEPHFANAEEVVCLNLDFFRIGRQFNEKIASEKHLEFPLGEIDA